jgi:MFS family permease
MLSVGVALPAAVCKPVWGWAMDYASPKLLAAGSFVVAAIGVVVVVLAAQAQSVVVLGAGFILVGWGLGGQIPIQEVIWASYFGRRYLGAVRSVAMPFALFFGAGGPLAVQIYFDVVGDYYGAFYGVGGALAPSRRPRAARAQAAAARPHRRGAGAGPVAHRGFVALGSRVRRVARRGGWSPSARVTPVGRGRVRRARAGT